MTAVLRAAVLFALVLLVAARLADRAAAAPPPCPASGALSAKCTKEIRIWNNTGGPIYAVLQASKQLTDALNCPLKTKGGGDVWLQAAFGDSTKCYPVKDDYYVFINPKTGIATNSFASISVPWWSKRQATAPDLYVDWWRGARLFILDDKNALLDSLGKLGAANLVKFAAGSPLVACTKGAANKCLAAELAIYQVPATAVFGTRTPYQLNEFTFASVSPLESNGTAGGKFVDFNQGYNVSYVDQVYLPIAIEPVRQPALIGYLGTVSSVVNFRKALAAFTGADKNPKNPPNWPIYNNPIVKGSPTYPKAGVRVPSTETVFDFYALPYYFPGGGKIPQIIPAPPAARPKLVTGLMAQWTACTTGKGNCPDSKIYREENAVFAASYKFYIANCTPPAWLKPVMGTNPPAPTLAAYLRFIYGWVPFNVGCAAPDLPTVDDGSRAPIDYINVQYNYQDTTLTSTQWFNPYTQLIHGAATQGGLDASAYAFSIDDHASFLSNDGGSTPGGLIVAVGGATGLPNKNRYPPPTPPVYRFFDFSVDLGAPGANAKGSWAKYGLCSTNATVPFPPSLPPGGNGAYSLGVDPAVQTFPCTVTLSDSNNKTYQVKVLKAAIPPKAIWPKWTPSAGKLFDPTVVSCPASGGVVPPAQWCVNINETANPTPKPPIYSLGTPGPL